MPQNEAFPISQTGLDYSRLQSTLLASKTQSTNNALYQTINQIIDGLRKFQGLLEGKFGSLDSDISSLFSNINLITEELSDRNSTKYSISLTNSDYQSIGDSSLTRCTFSETIYDDGLMFNGTDSFTINANAQFLIVGRVKFAASKAGLRRVSVHLNEKRQFSTEIDATTNEAILPFCGIIECLRNDVISVFAFQASGSSLNIIPSVQACRLTFVNMGSGRNLIESDSGKNDHSNTGGDGTTGGGSGGGTGGPTGCAAIPPPSAPDWFISIINSHGATNCYDPAVLGASENDLKALNYYIQKSSGGDIRARLYYPCETCYEHPIDVSRPDGGWGWLQR